MNKKKKRAITLIEIMIVILLIGLIGGALAFNMRGSMDQGRAFKTEQSISRIQEAIMLQVASGEIEDLQKTVNDKEALLAALKQSPLIKDTKNILKDGWGKELAFRVDSDEVIVSSQKLEDWKRAHKQ